MTMISARAQSKGEDSTTARSTCRARQFEPHPHDDDVTTLMIVLFMRSRRTDTFVRVFNAHQKAKVYRLSHRVKQRWARVPGDQSSWESHLATGAAPGDCA